MYYAQGVLNTNQDTIVATRNGILVQDNVEETTSNTFRTTVRRKSTRASSTWKVVSH